MCNKKRRGPLCVKFLGPTGQVHYPRFVGLYGHDKRGGGRAGGVEDESGKKLIIQLRQGKKFPFDVKSKVFNVFRKDVVFFLFLLLIV